MVVATGGLGAERDGLIVRQPPNDGQRGAEAALTRGPRARRVCTINRMSAPFVPPSLSFTAREPNESTARTRNGAKIRTGPPGLRRAETSFAVGTLDMARGAIGGLE